jgi:hypothetical protein
MVRHIQRSSEKEPGRNAGGGGVADGPALGSAEPVLKEQARDKEIAAISRRRRRRAEKRADAAWAERQHSRRELLLAGGFSPAEAEARTQSCVRRDA